MDKGGFRMLIRLDFKSEVPIYLQLRNQIVLGIARGDLRAGESLPTVRQMAQDSGVNAMTVSKAYAMLKTEGFLSVDRRHGATVNPPRNKSGAAESLVLERNLELTVSEAGLRGVSESEFLTVCKRIYRKMDGLKSRA